jgi:hypothetical protein
MANYGYVRIQVAPGKPKAKRMAAFEPVLVRCVERTLGKPWQVTLADFAYDGPTWIVSLPGTAVTDARKATQRMLAPGQDVGFVVSLQPRAIAFRHPPNMFERWAQGRVEEEIADHYGRGIFFDATDRTQKTGTREYRKGKTFRDYLCRNFKKPLSGDDAAWIDRFKEQVPKGHW